MTIEDDVMKIVAAYTLEHYSRSVAIKFVEGKSSNPEHPEHHNVGAVNLAEDIVVKVLQRVKDSDSCICRCNCC